MKITLTIIITSIIVIFALMILNFSTFNGKIENIDKKNSKNASKNSNPTTNR